MSTITKERLQRLIRAIDSESYDEEEIVEWVNSDEIMELARIALASIEAEPMKEPELKPAELINKFYERYPLDTFKSDAERAEALGYFMAGAELQCFGEFVKYEDLCCDE